MLDDTTRRIPHYDLAEVRKAAKLLWDYTQWACLVDEYSFEDSCGKVHGWDRTKVRYFLDVMQHVGFKENTHDAIPQLWEIDKKENY